jgi:hypothetical protein
MKAVWTVVAAKVSPDGSGFQLTVPVNWSVGVISVTGVLPYSGGVTSEISEIVNTEVPALFPPPPPRRKEQKMRT